jgi:uncharacterized FlaG/YvyC family protein
MDVASSQAATASTASAASAAAAAAYAAVDTDPGPAQYTVPVVAATSGGGSASSATASAGGSATATTPAAKTSASANAQPPAGPLEPFAGAVTTVFAGQNIEVNFRVAHDPNEIVIVYRNAETGEIINQVPPEAIVRLAEFFQREASGAILDQGA